MDCPWFPFRFYLQLCQTVRLQSQSFPCSCRLDLLCASSSACSQPFSLFHLGCGDLKQKRDAHQRGKDEGGRKKKTATAFVDGPFDPKLSRTSLKSVHTVSHLVVLDAGTALRMLATRPAFLPVMTVVEGEAEVLSHRCDIDAGEFCFHFLPSWFDAKAARSEEGEGEEVQVNEA